MASIGVQMAESPTKWSLEPLLHGHQPTDVVQGIIDISFYGFVACMMLVMSLMYPLVHKMLLVRSKRYAAMEDPGKQIIVTHHALEAVVLSVVFPFFSYFFVGVFFREIDDVEEFVDSFRSCALCAFAPVMMYISELASRFQHPRPLVIVHHVLATMDMIIAIFFPTSIMFKTAIILVYMICFEALIFAGLFLYRIVPERRIASDVLMAGMVVFGLTRPLQVLLVGAAVFGSWDVVVRWQAIFQFVMTLLLTTIQVFTLKIQYGVWQRCVAKRKAVADHGEGEDAKDRDIESDGVPDNTGSGKGESTESTES